MPITEIREKKTERSSDVYPGGEFFGSLLRMLQERTPIKIGMTSVVTGDILFMVNYSDLGISPQILSHPIFRTNAFANLLGEVLVRGNLSLFCEKVMDKNYDALVKKYNHKDFGLRSKGAELLLFQFHVSLIHRIVNELLLQEIAADVAKITLACPKKVKREDENPSITSYCDDGNNLRLVVTKGSEVRVIFQKAIETILNYYKITGKQVDITSNIFNFDIEIKDEGKCSQ